MSATPKDIHYYTLAEYFDFIKANDGRYEYRDGEIVPMRGGSKNHTNPLTVPCDLRRDEENPPSLSIEFVYRGGENTR
jgi:hypothetical protein